MAIRYNCRHCAVQVGELDQKRIDTEQLGFGQLNHQERIEMVQYLSNGDVEVKTICEDCQEALERNPDLHSLNTFIQ